MSGPERIYLQDAGDYSKAAAFEVTWCVEPQDDDDTEYVRADAVAEMIRQAVTAEREACAVVTETMHETSWPDTIAAAIRARGDA